MGFQAHFLSLKAYYQGGAAPPSLLHPAVLAPSHPPRTRVLRLLRRPFFLQTLHRSGYWAVAQDFAGVGLARPTIHQLSTNLRNGWTSPASPFGSLSPDPSPKGERRKRQKPEKPLAPDAKCLLRAMDAVAV